MLKNINVQIQMTMYALAKLRLVMNTMRTILEKV